jgi:hypothetical protein
MGGGAVMRQPIEAAPVVALDNDGNKVKAGDTISFSFGIPGRRVEGVLFERDGKLIVPTPDVTPKEATLAMLRHHVGGFYKLRR